VRSYKLTDFGKTLIVVLLMVLLFVISVFALTIGSCSRVSPPTDDLPQSSPSPQNGYEITPTPPITPNPSPGNVTPSPAPDSLETAKPPSTPDPDRNGDDGNGNDIRETGPVGLNIAEGTMSFLFSPQKQDSLDDDTASMLSEFLSSPKNTKDALIQVEMPGLDDDTISVLLSAVTTAFSSYGVPLSDIVYIKNTSEVTEHYFEVKLSYYTPTESK